MINHHQTWNIDAMCQPLYVNEVKGHIPRSRLMSGQVLKLAKKIKLLVFPNGLINYHQTWNINAICQP